MLDAVAAAVEVVGGDDELGRCVRKPTQHVERAIRVAGVVKKSGCLEKKRFVAATRNEIDAAGSEAPRCERKAAPPQLLRDEVLRHQGEIGLRLSKTKIGDVELSRAFEQAQACEVFSWHAKEEPGLLCGVNVVQDRFSGGVQSFFFEATADVSGAKEPAARFSQIVKNVFQKAIVANASETGGVLKDRQREEILRVLPRGGVILKQAGDGKPAGGDIVCESGAEIAVAQAFSAQIAEFGERQRQHLERHGGVSQCVGDRVRAGEVDVNGEFGATGADAARPVGNALDFVKKDVRQLRSSSQAPAKMGKKRVGGEQPAVGRLFKVQRKDVVIRCAAAAKFVLQLSQQRGFAAAPQTGEHLDGLATDVGQNLLEK